MSTVFWALKCALHPSNKKGKAIAILKNNTYFAKE